ncbi:MAG TPA: sigma-54 dependent transcriptional regulator [Planctomycetota bacterium]|nr:sigma-54 dependent transcriptional regulator [Planctomycetota bacterium]
MLRILIVDDEPSIRAELEEALEEAGYETHGAGDGRAAADLALQHSFDLCLSDIRMPSLGGIELLRQLRETSPETMVILMTAHAELDTAIEALRLGAVDYLLKPFKQEELIAKVQRLADHRRLVLENRNLRRAVDAGAPRDMIGGSPAMMKVLETVDLVASLPSHVLITGESGTGKDLVARAIHGRGSRAQAPFVPINCAAIPEMLLESELFGHVKGSFTGAIDNKEGLLKTAGEGTIFLDELGDMPMPIQAKLLRAIESREIQPVGSTRRVQIQARILAATNRELRAEAQAGRFREDLYYRLAVVEIHVPPLRDRREDIPLLANHFVEKYARELGRGVRGISREALRLLSGYDWRGNIRELSNAIERAVIFTALEEIVPADLPDPVRAATPRDREYSVNLREATAEFERAHILRVIEQCEGNKRKAARLLGMGVTSLYRKLGAPVHQPDAGKP